jgi:hypothetical protein
LLIETARKKKKFPKRKKAQEIFRGFGTLCRFKSPRRRGPGETYGSPGSFAGGERRKLKYFRQDMRMLKIL